MRLLLFFICAVSCFAQIERYTSEEMCSGDRVLVFVHFQEGKDCVSCERYKSYLENFPHTETRLRRIEFAANPLMALRFGACSFPSFFYQERGLFWNITDVDFRKLKQSLDRGRAYENDIDALLSNRESLLSLPTMQPTPRSLLAYVYALGMSCIFVVSRVLDYCTELVPLWVFGAGILVLLLLLVHVNANHVKLKSPGPKKHN
jgi:hypothetical protein